MAERRYGFRFSFAEGGVIVVSMIGAAFLVFLFGVYTGRELEARKNAANTRTVRVNTLEKVSDAPLEGVHESSVKKEGRESANFPPITQGAAKTVVVVTPQKQNQLPAATPSPLIAAPSSTSSPIPPEKEAVGKTEVLHKIPPVLVKKTENHPPPVATPIARGRKPSPREMVPSTPPSKKMPTTGGGWSVQVHATRDENSARRVARGLRSQGYAPVISKVVRDGQVWYRVRVGSFRTADEARASVKRFRREGKFSQAYPVSN